MTRIQFNSNNFGLELIVGNRVSGEGWIEKFLQPFEVFLLPLIINGLEIFPSFDRTRRQTIHRLDFWFFCIKTKERKKIWRISILLSTCHPENPDSPIFLKRPKLNLSGY